MKKYNVKTVVVHTKKQDGTDIEAIRNQKDLHNLVINEKILHDNMYDYDYFLYTHEEVLVDMVGADSHEEATKKIEKNNWSIKGSNNDTKIISQVITEETDEVVENVETEILISHSDAENNLLEMDMNNIDEVMLLESTSKGQIQTVLTRKMCEAVVFHSENYEKTKDGRIIYKDGEIDHLTL